MELYHISKFILKTFFEPGNISMFNFGGRVYAEERRALLYFKTLVNFYLSKDYGLINSMQNFMQLN